MSSRFTPEEIARLEAPHIAMAWFLEMDLPSGMTYLHSGVGTVTVGGHEWRGVSDPIGGRLLSLAGLEEPVFGQATAVTITLSGADVAFMRSVRATRRDIEGRSCNIYWCAFDGESAAPIGRLIPLYTRGSLSSPALTFDGIGRRSVSITVENVWQSQNFIAGRSWSGAGQREAYPGDEGLDFAGVKVSENWT